MTNKDYAVKLCRDKGCIYWRIEDPKSGLLVCDQDKNISSTESAQDLQDALDGLRGMQKVSLRIKPFPDTPGRTKKAEEYTLIVDCNLSKKESSTGINGIGLGDYLSLHNQMQELRIEMIRKEMESDNQANSMVEAFAKKALETPAIMEGIGNLIQSFVPKKKTAPVKVEPEITGAVVKINPEIINRLAAKDPDLPNTLEMLAAYMEKHPETLEAIKATMRANL